MPVPQKPDIQKYAWFLFLLLTSCYALVSFFRTSTSTLAVDIMKDFAVGGGLMSVMSSAYFYPYGFMQIPAGILSDRWGSRNTITLFMLLGAAGTLELKGLFPSCTFNWFCESSGFCAPLVGWVGSGARVESPLAGSWILSTTLVWRLYI